MPTTHDSADTVSVPRPTSNAGAVLHDDLTWQVVSGLTEYVIDLDTGTLVIDLDETPPELVKDAP